MRLATIAPYEFLREVQYEVHMSISEFAPKSSVEAEQLLMPLRELGRKFWNLNSPWEGSFSLISVTI